MYSFSKPCSRIEHSLLVHFNCHRLRTHCNRLARRVAADQSGSRLFHPKCLICNRVSWVDPLQLSHFRSRALVPGQTGLSTGSPPQRYHFGPEYRGLVPRKNPRCCDCPYCHTAYGGTAKLARGQMEWRPVIPLPLRFYFRVWERKSMQNHSVAQGMVGRHRG